MRTVFRPAAVLSIVVLCLVGVAAGQDVLHHDLTITLNPDSHRIDVVDLINPVGRVAGDAEGAYRFVLHAGLAPEVVAPGWRLEPVEGEITANFFGINATTATVEDTVPLEGWRLVPEDGAQTLVELRYGGAIHHILEQQGEEYQRSFSETPGFIGPEGIFLSGTSFWVPTFGDGLMTFEMEVQDLAKGWQVISQGRRTQLSTDDMGATATRWSFEHPTEEIYLVGGPLEVFEDRQGEVEVFAYLRSPDAALATRYLDATKRYLRLYNSMLPDYPFASFALVENFWETGYGMPGFTLLGPQVIRFPWILTSSYPHELLHNWWGNSAYVDFDRGNWCEGLTAYMADHLLAEQRGEGEIYRRSTLKKFTDLVSADVDFPLVEFHSRNSGASEAVGYGKSLMLFHMMRQSVGNEKFLEGVTEFYLQQRFKRASFGDIAAAFAAVGAGHWEDFVEAWTTRTGAPKLEIAEVQVKPTDDPEHPWLLEMEVTQTVDGGDAFPLALPIAVTMEGHDEAIWVETGTCGGDCRLRVPCVSRPLRVDVDPAFDVMRRLDPLEVPPALSTLMGADDVLYVIPSSAPADESAAWRELASGWAAPAEARVVLDSGLEFLPESPTWVLGWNNRFAGEVAVRLEAQGVTLDSEGLTLPEELVARTDHSTVLVARGKTDPTTAVGWVGASPVEAIAGLARKLPHYQKYSYLAFKGPEPSNTTKGMWTPAGSPLVRNLSDGPLPELVLPKRAPLAELPPVYEAENFGKTVRFLADPALEGRGLGSEGLAKATDWVEQRFTEIGLSGGAEGMRQVWSYRGGKPEREMELTNLAAEIPGTDLTLVNQPVVVVAHLDHLGHGWPDVREGNEGQVHPGADDNASGVAVLLELARALKAEGPRPRSVIFLVTTAEEVGLVGARHWVKSLADGVKPFAAVNLDTVGRLKEGALFVLNSDTAREWRFIFMG
ncbi:MAG: M20/M25/M40 family metallo-hydrolase, partial [Acidobacteria bacterium]|nr:M20/M25/M40 family metallo-hydrolase [Acidobacteriota bacterium]